MSAENLFKKELESKMMIVLEEQKVNTVLEAANKYIGVDNTTNGKEFFEKIILDAPKDYPTDSMKFYQSVTELKARISRVFDESIELKKMEIEKEIIELDLEEMQINKKTRRDELNILLKEQELTQKRVRVAFARKSLEALVKEVEDFKSICDKYYDTGTVKPFQLARLEEMELKKRALYLNHVLTGRPLSSSETSFFYQNNGVLLPPPGVVEELHLLGRDDLAMTEQNKINSIENAKLLLGCVAAPLQIESSFEDAITIVQNKE